LKNALVYYNAGVVAVNSKVVELAQGYTPTESIKILIGEGKPFSAFVKKFVVAVHRCQ
jgi:hypothetical protein